MTFRLQDSGAWDFWLAAAGDAFHLFYRRAQSHWASDAERTNPPRDVE